MLEALVAEHGYGFYVFFRPYASWRGCLYRARGRKQRDGEGAKGTGGDVEKQKRLENDTIVCTSYNKSPYDVSGAAESLTPRYNCYCYINKPSVNLCIDRPTIMLSTKPKALLWCSV